MTNLYDFLRKIHAKASADDLNVFQPTDAELKWLEQFLQSPDTEIHFKATDTGDRVKGEPVMWQNYAIAGNELDVFCLMSEAAMINMQFQTIVRGVVAYLDSQVPPCKFCNLIHTPGLKCPPLNTWAFPNQ